jgi:hypothetical protein
MELFMKLSLPQKLNIKPSLIAPVTFALLLTCSLEVLADDVTDQIEEAVKAYEKEDYNTAVTALDSASTLIRQKKGELVSKLLPEPLDGWEAQEAKSSSAGAGMFGGGISANKSYTQKVDGKTESITISITTDSPLIQTMGMMFSNPMFMGGDNKLMVINGEKAIADTNNNKLTAMIANKVLVEVSGKRGASTDHVKDYFKSIDFKAIKEYAQ